MTRIDSDGSTFKHWANVDPAKSDTGGIGDQGGYGADSARPLLNPNVATAAGRFLDPMTARVLSLKLTLLGSDGPPMLSSATGTADRKWASGLQTATPCQIGDTCSLAVADAAGPIPPMITMLFGRAAHRRVSRHWTRPAGPRHWAAVDIRWRWSDRRVSRAGEQVQWVVPVACGRRPRLAPRSGRSHVRTRACSRYQLWKEVSDPNRRRFGTSSSPAGRLRSRATPLR
jgi:hypothetical protein